jgi:hypothetical protein
VTGARRHRSLKDFIIRGVLNVGIPVAIFAFTMVFLRLQPDGWHAMLSGKFLLALLFGAIPGGVLGGALYGMTMWMFFAKDDPNDADRA